MDPDVFLRCGWAHQRDFSSPHAGQAQAWSLWVDIQNRILQGAHLDLVQADCKRMPSFLSDAIQMCT